MVYFSWVHYGIAIQIYSTCQRCSGNASQPSDHTCDRASTFSQLFATFPQMVRIFLSLALTRLMLFIGPACPPALSGSDPVCGTIQTEGYWSRADAHSWQAGQVSLLFQSFPLSLAHLCHFSFSLACAALPKNGHWTRGSLSAEGVTPQR